MAIYAIGDIQGCFDDLLRLLDVIDFHPQQDQLWFTGDLVNRGPKSLETLRFVKSLQDAAVAVLGNHDMHLLATYYLNQAPKKKDGLGAILAAPDRDELINWLRHRPLLHYSHDFCLIHAGLPPQWDFAQAQAQAKMAEQVLQSDAALDFFNAMYGDETMIWSEQLQGMELIRFIVNCFTRLRYCDSAGQLDFRQKGRPGGQPAHLHPWFVLPQRKTADIKIIFGHWATLGFYQGHNCYGIDTGALWGGQLTALKLGTIPERISIDCRGERKPDKD